MAPMTLNNKAVKPTWLHDIFHPTGDLKATLWLGAGKPWMLGSRRFGFRSTISFFPLCTMGGFLSCVIGDVSLVLTPVEKIVQQGSCVTSFHSMLQALTPADAKRWMQKSSSVVSLATGSLLWIPYGYFPWLIGTSSAISYCLWLPVFSPSLMSAQSGVARGAVSDYITTFVKGEGAAMFPDKAKIEQFFSKPA